MTSKPFTCSPDDTLERAATLMHEHDVSRLPVTEGGKLVGIIARGDILRAVMGA
jgi:CIC family chloride channel protein